jgi:hypothetical protein
MPRLPQLRKKKVRDQLWWYTDAGGSATYFGKVEDAPFAVANRQFAEHITSLSDSPAPHKRGALSAGAVMDLFVDYPAVATGGHFTSPARAAAIVSSSRA